MRFLTFTFLIGLFSMSAFAQLQQSTTIFNEQYFQEFDKRYQSDPIQCLENEADPNFTIVYSDGSSGYRESLQQFYKQFNIVSHTFLELKTQQCGNTGIVTGILNRAHLFKKDTTLRDWSHRFTYTFSWQKTKWLLVAMQLTEISTDKGSPYEEAALKKLIDEEAVAFSKADKESLLKVWKNDAKTLFLGSSASGNFYNLNADSFKNYIKNNLSAAKFVTVNSNHRFNFKGNIVIVDYDRVMTTSGGKKLFQHNVNAFEKVAGEWRFILTSSHGLVPPDTEKKTEVLKHETK